MYATRHPAKTDFRFIYLYTDHPSHHMREMSDLFPIRRDPRVGQALEARPGALTNPSERGADPSPPHSWGAQKPPQWRELNA